MKKYIGFLAGALGATLLSGCVIPDELFESPEDDVVIDGPVLAGGQASKNFTPPDRPHRKPPVPDAVKTKKPEVSAPMKDTSAPKKEVSGTAKQENKSPVKKDTGQKLKKKKRSDIKPETANDKKSRISDTDKFHQDRARREVMITRKDAAWSNPATGNSGIIYVTDVLPDMSAIQTNK